MQNKPLIKKRNEKLLKKKKTKMTGDTVQEELNTEFEDTTVANTEETQDTSLDQKENLATRLNEETQPLEPDPSNLSFNNATDIKPATIEDQQDSQIEYSVTGNNTLEPSPSNQSYNSESPKTNSLASESPQTNSLATDIKPSLPHNSSTDKTQSQHINSTKKTQISNNGANNSEETDSDPSESQKTNSLAPESPQKNSLATDIRPSLPHNSSKDKTQSQHINSTKKKRSPTMVQIIQKKQTQIQNIMMKMKVNI